MMNNGEANRDHLERTLAWDCTLGLLFAPLSILKVISSAFWNVKSHRLIQYFHYQNINLLDSILLSLLCSSAYQFFPLHAQESERDVGKHLILINGFTLMNGLSSALRMLQETLTLTCHTQKVAATICCYAANWITYYISWRISLAWETGDCLGCKTVGVCVYSVYSLGWRTNISIIHLVCCSIRYSGIHLSLFSHLQGLQEVRWWDTLRWFHSKLACCCCAGQEELWMCHSSYWWKDRRPGDTHGTGFTERCAVATESQLTVDISKSKT